MVSADNVRDFARRIGLDLIGITSAEPFPAYAETVQYRVENSCIPPESQESEDIFRRVQFYSDPQNSLPRAQSVILLGMCYFISGKADSTRPGRPCGSIGRHYWRDFYGELWRKKANLVKVLESKGVLCSKETYLPFKLVAQRAGIGWYGKNDLIQTHNYGSWVIFAAIVTDADLDIDEPIPRDCGTCHACMKACPTQAIVTPYTINIAKCINHLTATSGNVPVEFRSLLGNQINSCDQCQVVCPNNRGVIPVRKRVPNPRRKWGTSPPLLPLLDISQQEFKTFFADLDWYKPELRFLQRNIVVALGNIKDPVALPALKRMVGHPESVIRSHAAWALGRIGGHEARQILRVAQQTERETEVLGEIEGALEM